MVGRRLLVEETSFGGSRTLGQFLYSFQQFQQPTLPKGGLAQDETIKLWDIAVATQADK